MHAAVSSWIAQSCPSPPLFVLQLEPADHLKKPTGIRITTHTNRRWRQGMENAREYRARRHSRWGAGVEVGGGGPNSFPPGLDGMGV